MLVAVDGVEIDHVNADFLPPVRVLLGSGARVPDDAATQNGRAYELGDRLGHPHVFEAAASVEERGGNLRHALLDIYGFKAVAAVELRVAAAPFRARGDGHRDEAVAVDEHVRTPCHVLGQFDFREARSAERHVFHALQAVVQVHLGERGVVGERTHANRFHGGGHGRLLQAGVAHAASRGERHAGHLGHTFGNHDLLDLRGVRLPFVGPARAYRGYVLGKREHARIVQRPAVAARHLYGVRRARRQK